MSTTGESANRYSPTFDRESDEYQSYTQEERECIYGILQAKEEHQGYLGKGTYESLDVLPSSKTILKIFGRWSNAKEAAGLPTHPSRGQYNKQDCIEAIQEAVDILGYAPGIRDYDELGLSPSRKVIKRLFGRFNNAIRAAGYEPNTSRPATAEPEYSIDDCISGLREAADLLGRSPTQSEYRDLDISPSYYVIVKRLGSFNEAKEKAGLKCYNTGDGWQKSNPKRNNYGPNWSNIRQSVFEEHGEQCHCCGISRKENEERCGKDISIHHIVPFKKFNNKTIANHYTNLIPLCHRCHQKIEARTVTEQCDLLGVPKPVVEPYTEIDCAKEVLNKIN